MAVKKSILAAAAVCAMAAGLVGCSGGGGTELEGSSAKEIANRAAKAMKATESMRLTGHIMDDDKKIEIDMSVAKGGKCTGSMTLEGGTAEVISTGDQTYLKGNEQFWKGQSEGEPGAEMFVQLLKDRWMKQPGGSGEGFDDFCDLDSLLKDLDEDEVKDATKGELTDVDGRQAIPLVRKEDGETTTMYIANDDDKPYILRMQKKGGDDAGVVDFTDHDKKFEVKEPDPADVVDLNDLEELGAE